MPQVQTLQYRAVVGSFWEVSLSWEIRAMHCLHDIPTGSMYYRLVPKCTTSIIVDQNC